MSEPEIGRWRQLDPVGPKNPKPRHGHRAVVVKDMMIVFGGGNEGIVDELHAFKPSIGQWIMPEVKGDIPPGCAAFGIATDGTRLFIFGGMVEYGKYSNDLYELKVNNWEWKKVRVRSVKGRDMVPVPRLGHSFTMVGNKIFLFGGLANQSTLPHHNIPKYLNDLHVLELKNHMFQWETPHFKGKAPSPRESHSAVSYTTKTGAQKLLIFGGMCGNRLNDVYVLDIESMAWTEISFNTKDIVPPPRSLHSATVINNKMYVFGGWVPIGNQNEVQKTSAREWRCSNTLAVMDLERYKWVYISPESSPEHWPKARAGHSAVTYHSRLYIWSGRDGYRKDWDSQVCCNDLWFLETQKPSAPTRIQLSKATTTTLEVTWAPVPNADYYMIQIQKCELPTNGQSESNATSAVKKPTPPISTPSTPSIQPVSQPALAPVSSASVPLTTITPTVVSRTPSTTTVVTQTENTRVSTAVTVAASSVSTVTTPVGTSAVRVVTVSKPSSASAIQVPNALNTLANVSSGVPKVTTAPNIRIISQTPTAVSGSGANIQTIRLAAPNSTSAQSQTVRLISQSGNNSKLLLKSPGNSPQMFMVKTLNGQTFQIAQGTQKNIMVRAQTPSTTTSTIQAIQTTTGSVSLAQNIASSATTPAGTSSTPTITSFKLISATNRPMMINGQTQIRPISIKAQPNNKIIIQQGGSNPQQIRVIPNPSGNAQRVVLVNASQTSAANTLKATDQTPVVVSSAASDSTANTTTTIAAPPTPNEAPKIPQSDGADDEQPSTNSTSSSSNVASNQTKEGIWFDVGIASSNTFQISGYFFQDNVGQTSLEDPPITSDSLPDYRTFKKVALDSGTAYKIRVAAINVFGKSEWSEVFSSLKTCFPGYPAAPNNIKITKSNEGAQISWSMGNMLEPVLEYSVYLAVSADANRSAQGNQLQFLKVYGGARPSCLVHTEVLANAHLDQGNKPAIIFRIAARNNKGYGPATQVRWLQEPGSEPKPPGFSQAAKRPIDEVD